jgi:replicative DNA helicase
VAELEIADKPRRARRDGAGPEAPSVRRIPADHEAERAVLGSILLDPDALYHVVDKVKAAHFDEPRHRVIFQAFVDLAERAQALTLITLRNHLVERGELERAGGVPFLAALADAVPTAAHAAHHARIVRDKALARSLIRTCERVAAKGYDGDVPVTDLLEEAEREVLHVAMGHVDVGFSGVADELESTFEYIEKVQSGQITGVRTGFEDFDRLTGGLNGGDLVILAARPGVGKTALALNIARNCAVQYGGCVAIFSLEMTTRQLILRLLMAEAEIDFSRFRAGYLGDRDWPRLTRAADVLSNARIYIDDSGSVTVSDLGAKARRLDREHKLSLIVVDYLQLMRGSSEAERREQEIAETTRALKLLAKDLDLPVIALSQLNRGPETRPNPHKRPVLADLRESGAIEQDADLVVFIYRDELYNEDTDEKGMAELIIAKQRNGPTDTVRLQFQGKHARFHALSERTPPPPRAGFDPGPEAAADAGWGPRRAEPPDPGEESEPPF